MSDLEKFEQWKEYIEHVFGKNTFLKKAWLQQEWQKITTLTKRAEAMMTLQNSFSNKIQEQLQQTPLSSPATSALQQPLFSNNVLSRCTSLEQIQAELGECTRCKLSPTRTHLVFGEGNPKANLMFVGEGPGEQEDLQGRPFVGRAGQLLDKIIEAMGLKRELVYIANVVKCRPPNNRAPQPDEVETCRPFLFQQIDVIAPSVIVALGATALKCLLGADTQISKIRGNFTEFRGRKLMPTFHPAYLLRNPAAKKDVWDDMKKVMLELGLKK